MPFEDSATVRYFILTRLVSTQATFFSCPVSIFFVPADHTARMEGRRSRSPRWIGFNAEHTISSNSMVCSKRRALDIVDF